MAFSALIAENHDPTRQGIRSLLTERLGAYVSASTSDGPEVFPLVDEHRPDLLVLDLGLPHLNGLNVLQKIQRTDLSPRSVVLSMYADETYVRKAFELGALGYVLKGTPLDELCTALRTALDGDHYLSSGLPDGLVEPARPPDAEPDDRYGRLTEREREVLQLTAEGFTSSEVGNRFDISPRTVEKHRENIRRKLDLRNVVEMAAYVHRHGLAIELSSWNVRPGRASQGAA
ncbi:MAG: response regulator [Salinibacter sp.]